MSDNVTMAWSKEVGADISVDTSQEGLLCVNSCSINSSYQLILFLHYKQSSIFKSIGNNVILFIHYKYILNVVNDYIYANLFNC